MNYYQLESRAMDQAFLSGEMVTCTAVVPDLRKLNEGDKIVIGLSNRSKYMGRIVKVNSTSEQSGHFQVVRN